MKKNCERDSGTAECPGLLILSQHSEAPPMHMLCVLLSTLFVVMKVGTGPTHSLSNGMDVLLLLFCTMLA